LNACLHDVSCLHDISWQIDSCTESPGEPAARLRPALR